MAVDLPSFDAMIRDLLACVPDTSACDAADGPLLLDAMSQADPTRVMRLRDALYAAYYASPSVQAALRKIADSAPRDPTRDFDDTLLATVKARGARPQEEGGR